MSLPVISFLLKMVSLLCSFLGSIQMMALLLGTCSLLQVLLICLPLFAVAYRAACADKKIERRMARKAVALRVAQTQRTISVA